MKQLSDEEYSRLLELFETAETPEELIPNAVLGELSFLCCYTPRELAVLSVLLTRHGLGGIAFLQDWACKCALTVCMEQPNCGCVQPPATCPPQTCPPTTCEVCPPCEIIPPPPQTKTCAVAEYKREVYDGGSTGI